MQLERLFAPAYRPSPGSVYPAMEALEAERLIDGSEQDGRTVYALTDTGRRALEDRFDLLAAIELRTGARLRADHSLDPVLARFKARVAPLSGRVDAVAVAEVLARAADEIESLDGHAKEKT